MQFSFKQIFILTGLVLFSLNGMTTERAPWLKPLAPGWSVQALLNVGDSVQGYRMVGIPDGLGVLDNGGGTISVFMNHEIAMEKGAIRRHGEKGAFVSRWKLDLPSLKITTGEDLTHFVNLWNPNEPTASGTSPHAFNRLCSADLAALPAFFDAVSSKGFNGRLLLNGEEDKSGGRVFAHVLTGPEEGVAYELPHFGKAAWENAVANPHAGTKTVVMALDDSHGGQVYLYIGEKQASGNPVERAGLVDGRLHAIRVNKNRFDLVAPGDVTKMSSSALEPAKMPELPHFYDRKTGLGTRAMSGYFISPRRTRSTD